MSRASAPAVRAVEACGTVGCRPGCAEQRSAFPRVGERRFGGGRAPSEARVPPVRPSRRRTARFAPRPLRRTAGVTHPPFRLWPRLPPPPTPVRARRRRRAADAGRRARQGKALSARGRYAPWLRRPFLMRHVISTAGAAARGALSARDRYALSGGRPVPHATHPPDHRRPSSTSSLGSRPLRIVIKAPIPYAVRHPYRRRPSSRSSGSRRTRSASNGVSQKHVASQARRVMGVRDQLELSYTSTYRRMSPLVSTESNERPLPARALGLARRRRRPPRRRRRQGRRGACARRVLARARPRDAARARRQTRPLVAVQGVRRGSHGVVTMCAVLQWNGLYCNAMEQVTMCAVRQWNELCCNATDYTVLQCTVLLCNVLRCTVIPCDVMRCKCNKSEGGEVM